jgi:hypothetical protein
MPADPYRFGTRSDATRALQAALTAAGFDAGRPTAFSAGRPRPR